MSLIMGNVFCIKILRGETKQRENILFLRNVHQKMQELAIAVSISNLETCYHTQSIMIKYKYSQASEYGYLEVFFYHFYALFRLLIILRADPN